MPLVIGYDTKGKAVVEDLAKLPHLLVAGSTGSGKSVAINSMLMGLLYSKTPEELKLILIDPKRLELAPYNDIAHLLFPVATEPEKALSALKWLLQEMERRYTLMAENGIRSLQEKNNLFEECKFRHIFPQNLKQFADFLFNAHCTSFLGR